MPKNIMAHLADDLASELRGGVAISEVDVPGRLDVMCGETKEEDAKIVFLIMGASRAEKWSDSLGYSGGWNWLVKLNGQWRYASIIKKGDCDLRRYCISKDEALSDQAGGETSRDVRQFIHEIDSDYFSSKSYTETF